MANLLRLRAPTDIIYRERALANTDNPAAIPLTVCQSLSTRNLSSFVSIVSIDSDTFILVNFFILIRRKKSLVTIVARYFIVEIFPRVGTS